MNLVDSRVLIVPIPSDDHLTPICAALILYRLVLVQLEDLSQVFLIGIHGVESEMIVVVRRFSSFYLKPLFHFALSGSFYFFYFQFSIFCSCVFTIHATWCMYVEA